MIVPRKTKAGQTRYRVRVNNRAVGTYGTRREAKLAEAKALDATGTDAAVVTVKALWHAWEAEQEALTERGERSPGTLIGHRSSLRRFRADHDRRQAALITTAEARAFAATVSVAELRSLRALFNYGVQTGRVASNPFAPANVKRSTKGGRGEIRPGKGALRRAGLERLCDLADELGRDLQLGAMIRFAAWSCVRQGELFVAGPGALEDGGRVLDVREQHRSRYPARFQRALPKDREARRIRLVPEARAAIAHVDPAAAYFFTNTRGEHWTAGALAYQWKPIQAAFTRELDPQHWLSRRVRDGGSHLTWHELRHTGATLHLVAGASHEAVAQLLGHTTAELVLSTYGHYSETDAMEELDRIYERTPVQLVREAS